MLPIIGCGPIIGQLLGVWIFDSCAGYWPNMWPNYCPNYWGNIGPIIGKQDLPIIGILLAIIGHIHPIIANYWPRTDPIIGHAQSQLLAAHRPNYWPPDCHLLTQLLGALTDHPWRCKWPQKKHVANNWNKWSTPQENRTKKVPDETIRIIIENDLKSTKF